MNSKNSTWWEATFPKGRQTVTINDAKGQKVSIAYGEKGTGKPLILIHGWGSWSYSWNRNIEPLSRYFRVICFDAKGVGFSDKPLSPEKVGHQIIETAQLIELLCNEPAFIVSESLGAIIALAVAQSYPELISRLILIDAAIFPEKMPNWGMRAIVRIPMGIVIGFDRLGLIKIFAPLVRYFIKRSQNEIYHNPDKVSSKDIYWLAYPYIEFPHSLIKIAEESKLAAKEIKKMVDNKSNLINDVQKNLFKVTCPTLILWGEKDKWFPAKNGKNLQTKLANSTLKIIPNCGHHASSDCPEAVNSAIIAFLQ